VRWTGSIKGDVKKKHFPLRIRGRGVSDIQAGGPGFEWFRTWGAPSLTHFKGRVARALILNLRVPHLSRRVTGGAFDFSLRMIIERRALPATLRLRSVQGYSFLTSRNFTNAYAYDAASNRTGFTDPESGSTAYSYDTSLLAG